jgi:hypothetical protein
MQADKSIIIIIIIMMLLIGNNQSRHLWLSLDLHSIVHNVIIQTNPAQ